MRLLQWLLVLMLAGATLGCTSTADFREQQRRTVLTRYPVGIAREQILAQFGKPELSEVLPTGGRGSRSGGTGALIVDADQATLSLARRYDEYLTRKNYPGASIDFVFGYFVDRIFYDASDRVLTCERSQLD